MMTEVETMPVSSQLDAVGEIMKSGYWYERKVREVLKPFNISHEQYHVLKVLEENHKVKLSLKDVQSRLMNKTDNTTRLVDKLKQKGLVKSVYSTTNKRMLQIEITSKGVRLVEDIQLPLVELGNEIKTVLSDAESDLLARLLRKIRTAD